ncbi:hypothetical protein ACI2LF_18620 [Kribbella sp. NPDC020789]
MTAASAWSVFGAFGGIDFDVPQEADSDGLLYQYGIHDFSGEARFHFDLTRQFGLPHSDDYLQFHCDLQYLPTPAVEVLGSHAEWWFPGDGRRLPEWVYAVKRRPEWPVLESVFPTAVEVYCDEV